MDDLHAKLSSILGCRRNKWGEYGAPNDPPTLLDIVRDVTGRMVDRMAMSFISLSVSLCKAKLIEPSITTNGCTL